jgi:hypothetical protein
MVNYESLTSGKSGESPALCRSCKGIASVRDPSQNADEDGFLEVIIHFLFSAPHREGVSAVV